MFACGAFSPAPPVDGSLRFRLPILTRAPQEHAITFSATPPHIRAAWIGPHFPQLMVSAVFFAVEALGCWLASPPAREFPWGEDGCVPPKCCRRRNILVIHLMLITSPIAERSIDARSSRFDDCLTTWALRRGPLLAVACSGLLAGRGPSRRPRRRPQSMGLSAEEWFLSRLEDKDI